MAGVHMQEHRPGGGRGVEPGPQLVRRDDPATGRGRPAGRAGFSTGRVEHGQRCGTGRPGRGHRSHRACPAGRFGQQRGDLGRCGRGALDQPAARDPAQIGQQHRVTGSNGQERLPRQLRHRGGYPREQRRRPRLASEQRHLPHHVARPLPPEQPSGVAVQYVQHATLDKVEAVAAVPRLAQHRAGRQHTGPQLRGQLVACCLVEPVKQSLAHGPPPRPVSSISRCRAPLHIAGYLGQHVERIVEECTQHRTVFARGATLARARRRGRGYVHRAQQRGDMDQQRFGVRRVIQLGGGGRDGWPCSRTAVGSERGARATEVFRPVSRRDRIAVQVHDRVGILKPLLADQPVPPRSRGPRQQQQPDRRTGFLPLTSYAKASCLLCKVPHLRLLPNRSSWPNVRMPRLWPRQFANAGSVVRTGP